MTIGIRMGVLRISTGIRMGILGIILCIRMGILGICMGVRRVFYRTRVMRADMHTTRTGMRQPMIMHITRPLDMMMSATFTIVIIVHSTSAKTYQ